MDNIDVIVNIPLELVIEVFRYLEPNAPVILQRVSKAWQSLLITHEVLSIHTKDWYNGDKALVGQPRSTDALSIVQRKTEAMLRFMNGKPVTVLELKINLLQNWLPYIDPTMVLSVQDGWLTKRDLKYGGTASKLFEYNSSMQMLHISSEYIHWYTENK